MNIFNQREYACYLHFVRVHLVLWMCVCLFYLLNTGDFFWLMHTCISFEYVTSCENTFPDSSLPGPGHGRFILSYCGLNWERKTTNLWARHLAFLIPCWVSSQKKTTLCTWLVKLSNQVLVLKPLCIWAWQMFLDVQLSHQADLALFLEKS